MWLSHPSYKDIATGCWTNQPDDLLLKISSTVADIQRWQGLILEMFKRKKKTYRENWDNSKGVGI